MSYTEDENGIRFYEDGSFDTQEHRDTLDLMEQEFWFGKKNNPLSCANNIVHFTKQVGLKHICMYCGIQTIPMNYVIMYKTRQLKEKFNEKFRFNH